MRPLALACLVATLLLRLPCRAQESHPCREHARRLCPKAGTHAERLSCLERNKAVLPADCQEALARMEAAGKAFAADCRADAAKLCPGLDGHPLVECLEAKGPSVLSAACGGRLESMRRDRRIRKERIAAACKEDVDKLCRDVPPGEGAISRCLRGHEAELRKECRQVLPVAK